jgi:hypothetical protein
VSGDINVIYCAKDTQKLYLWSGSAYTEVFPSQALLDTYQLRSEKGNANGYASLDSGGKVPISQLPSSIMEYKGTWNAATNTPTLANGTGDTGDVYICNVAGTVNFGAGAITFAVGDYVIYSGTIWQRSSGAVGTVTSVAASITGDSITISGSPVTTSGTLAFAFNGTTAQYIRGNGTLETFPSLTGFVPYTGATANVDLGTHTLLAAKGIFSSSGSGDTVGITHSSGSGIALNITKGGNGEGLYINKTSGSGNAATIIGTLNATTLVKSGGTSSQFLKADGSVDSTAYGTGSVTSVGLSSSTSGVTIGSTPITTSGTITLSITTASGSQQGLLSSTDWTTFNNKQNALTNPVTGTGTNNYIPKFTTTGSTIGNSLLTDNGTNIGLGVANPTAGRLQINVSDTTTAAHLQIVDGTTTLANSFVTNFRNANDGDGRYILSRWQVQNAVGNDQNGFIGVQSVTGAGAYTPNIVFGQRTGVSTYATRMTLDASGNLGLGLSPSAWYTGYTAMQIGESASLFSNRTSADTRTTQLANNAFLNSNASNWIYQQSDEATRYGQVSGEHQWYTAPSGTAGNAISFTQAMTLTSGGNLLLGDTTNSGDRLRVVGTDYNNTAYLLGGSTTGASYGLQIRAGSNSTDYSLLVQSRAGSDYFRIAGTGAATFSSSVTATSGTFITSGSATNVLIGTTSTTGAITVSADRSNLVIGAAISNKIAFNNGSTTQTGYLFNSPTETALGYVGTFNLQIVGGGNILTATSGGNVGIGTNNPVSFTNYNTISVNGLSGGAVVTMSNGTSALRMACGGSDSALWEPRDVPVLFGTNNTERMRITSGGNVEIAIGSIKTGEPDTGYGRAAIKIGARNTGEAFNSGGHLPVNIDGTIYYINLYSSLP